MCAVAIGLAGSSCHARASHQRVQITIARVEDIGDAQAEAGYPSRGEGIVIDAAAHIVDGDVDRLDRHVAPVADLLVQRAERGEFEQSGDGAAMEETGAADDLFAERHHP